MKGVRFETLPPADFEKLIGETLGEARPGKNDVAALQRKKGFRPRKKTASGKKIDYEIIPAIDLHGFKKEEALLKLKNFVARHFENNVPTLLIITGKGINSGVDGPVLKKAVLRWLEENQGATVASFAHPPIAHGGSGAYLVRLKTN